MKLNRIFIVLLLTGSCQCKCRRKCMQQNGAIKGLNSETRLKNNDLSQSHIKCKKKGANKSLNSEMEKFDNSLFQVPWGTMSCRNSQINNLVVIENGTYMNIEKQSFEDCKAQCNLDFESDPNLKCLSYKWSQLMCSLHNITLQNLAQYGKFIGAPKDCSPVFNCDFYLIDCQVSGKIANQIDMKEYGERALQLCQQRCKITTNCYFFILERETYECTLYNNAERNCRAKMGAPKGLQNCNESSISTVSTITIDDTTTSPIVQPPEYTTTPRVPPPEYTTTPRVPPPEYTTTPRVPPPAFTKLLVALGENQNEDVLNEVEVIDLLSPTSRCKKLPNFPFSNQFSAGGLTYSNTPLICGGYFKRVSCHFLANGVWNIGQRLNMGRYFFAMIQSSFGDGGEGLLASGGEIPDGLNSVEILKKVGWDDFIELPVTISRHCMVRTQPNVVMVIGGLQNSRESPNTFTFPLNYDHWVDGPMLQIARISHACGMVKKDSSSDEKVVIVVGGYPQLSSSEVLLQGKWEIGPEFPLGFYGGAMVEDPSGGVIVVGGGTNKIYYDAIFRLPNAGLNEIWQKMDQKLSQAKAYFTAFLIPDELVDCSEQRVDSPDTDDAE